MLLSARSVWSNTHTFREQVLSACRLGNWWCFHFKVWAWDPQGSRGEVNELPWLHLFPTTPDPHKLITAKSTSILPRQGGNTYFWKLLKQCLYFDSALPNSTLGLSLQFFVKIWSLLDSQWIINACSKTKNNPQYHERYAWPPNVDFWVPWLP